MVTIMATIEGYFPQEQTDFLSLELGGKIQHIAAYSKGNGYIKLLSLKDYVNFCYSDKEYSSIDISLNLYNDDEAFEDFIKNTFFSNNLNF